MHGVSGQPPKETLHLFRTATCCGKFFSGRTRAVAVVLLATILVAFTLTGEPSATLHVAYRGEISTRILDRNGELLAIEPNTRGHFMTEATGTERFGELAVRSEDRYFYLHPGVNPVSMMRGAWRYISGGTPSGGSTITQQLVKNLLHHENERTIKNKLVETLYALALEVHTSKKEILTMYLNTAYFGERVEGIAEAALYYFGKDPNSLSDGEMVRLLALLAAPGNSPGTAANTERAKKIAERIGVASVEPYEKVPRALRGVRKDPAIFEIGSLVDCTGTCKLTVDRGLTETIRSMVRDRLNSPQFASVSNAAVAVIRLGKNEEPNTLLALVGTPDPYGTTDGTQLNMALLPRPIGSTWKPFIYGKAIEKGARPYTLIDDSEYRYEIGTGFAFYPKNYDGIYRGPVTLNYALSNSLNVPAVRALQFDGVPEFGAFMEESLGFIPRQSFDTYQLSVALGGLEMNPLLLAHYFTIFPRDGMLYPLTAEGSKTVAIPMSKPRSSPERVFTPTTTAMMSRMLADRLMGIEQFGLGSNLDLPFQEYAVKTGTSYDYHDSWTVGYTPDVVVVVWIGNTNNKAMDLLSGARGAGKIWNDVMNLLLARGDINPSRFPSSPFVAIETPEGNSFGFPDDDVLRVRMLMKDTELVLEPHNGDVLQYEEGMSVPLRATVPLLWSVDGARLGNGEKIFWNPTGPGKFILEATDAENKKSVRLEVSIVP